MTQLAVEWDERLMRDGLRYTSMKDAIYLDGPFREWRQWPDKDEAVKKRDELLFDLANILAAGKMRRLVATVRSSEFQSLSDQEKKNLGKDPHYAAFEACIVGALNGSRHELLIQVDLAEEYSEKCVALFHKIRKRRADAKIAVISLAFSDDERVPGLQMADMVSYCARADATRKSVQPNPLVERIIQLFHSQDHGAHRPFYLESGNGLGELEIE